MFVELHILQNFAPSCLNRDDTNSPKECEFGGYRRARISSQCIKRSIRNYFREKMLLPEENLGKRTKRLKEQLTDRLIQGGKDPAEADRVVETAIRGWGLGLKDEKTQYLLFLGEGEIASLAGACEENWSTLLEISMKERDLPADEELEGRKKKKAAKTFMPETFRRQMEKVLDGGKAADLALFGRMIADFPEKNIDAACQVAHAISAHKVSMEFDSYTALDDLKPEDVAGAEMMGVVEFNSACFYRYANIDVDQLKGNLREDEDLAKKAVEAFLRASVGAIPTGKQTSMAAQNPPSLVFGVVRRFGLWSLANAFLDPIRPDRNGGLMKKSIAALEEYWSKLVKAYGEDEILVKSALCIDGELQVLPRADRFNDLLRTLMQAIK